MFRKHFGNVVDVMGVVLGPLIYSLKIICFKFVLNYYIFLLMCYRPRPMQDFIIDECTSVVLFYTEHVHSCFHKCNSLMNWYEICNDTIEYIFCFQTPHFEFSICFICFTATMATQPCEKGSKRNVDKTSFYIPSKCLDEAPKLHSN